MGKCVVVSGLGGIPTNVCNGYRIAKWPAKKDVEVGVSQKNSCPLMTSRKCSLQC